MPKLVKELTVLAIKRLPEGTWALGGVKGFYLRKTRGTGFYFLRYKNGSGRHDYVLGSYSALSLGTARKLARQARERVEAGFSPIDDRKTLVQAAKEQRQQELKRQNVLTFHDIAEEWIEDRRSGNYWKNNKRGEQSTRQILERYVYPFLGSSAIEEINPENIKDCLAPIWQSMPSTARKAKTYMSKIFQWAIALRKRENRENPALMQGALGVLMEPLKNDRKETENHAACSVDELPKLIKEIHSYKSTSAQAVEFAILTATRSQAVRLAEWKEFDLEQGVWLIPLEHDKVKAPKRDRTIFLSEAAKELLMGLPRFSDSQYVFPSNRGGPLSSMGLDMFIRGLHAKKISENGIGWIDPEKSAREGKICPITLHGTCRATFRTWAKDDELGNNRRFDQQAVEMCLLHAKNDAYNGAYDRAPLAKERRQIMEAWGKYCMSGIHK